jgi:hypothetical protein
MDEAEIQAALRQNIATDPEISAPPIVTMPEPPSSAANTAVHIDLDEITQYKLHDFFGEPYKANDEIKRQQISYIYENVSKMVDSPEYGFVVAKLRDLERIIGISQSEDKIYKMYSWLKLNNIRKNVDLQMGAIGNA